MPLRIRIWKTLPPEHKDYLFIYLAGLIWATTLLVFTPTITHSFLGDVVVILWCSSAIIGAILAICGLLNRDNLLLERLGTTLIMVTPLVYSIAQAGLVVYAFFDPAASGEPTARLHLIFLGLWLFLFLNKRRRQLKARVKIVKEAPTASEIQGGS